MQRFFVTFPLQIDMVLTDADIFHQLTRVLRASIWDHIILFTGDGIDMEYEIIGIDKKAIRLKGVAQHLVDAEPRQQIILHQAIPNKYEKIEYIIQKWVEVGITGFVFFRSDRSQKLLVSPAKIERYHLIAEEALEQCGGARMPEIVFHERMMEFWQDETHIVLDTTGQLRWLTEYQTLGRLHLWVGPEGGWSETEKIKMWENSCIFARFWNRVLRTETAGIVVSFGILNW
jgi:16S rRNA (uracil1498-N3)-methyltransferase